MASNRRFVFFASACLTLAGLVLGSYLGAQAQIPTDDPLAEGARLFAENCAACHGADGQGRVGATLAKNWPSIRPDAQIGTIIANGIPGSVMPAWSQVNGGPLSEAQIQVLVSYILSWESGGPRQLPPSATLAPLPDITPLPDAAGDPNNGARLFAENCAICHGPNGEGRIGATLAKAWPSIRPDLRLRTTIAAGIAGSVMPAWSQANGGPLSEAEIDDLVAFVLTREPVEMVGVTPTPIAAAPASWLAGWGGVALAVVLFAALVTVAIWAQNRGTPA
ncbi:MAG: c-type cytochrome [Anaerolineales bacterium]|nr:c-type cytochrome [Anaerolineales bacterium]